MTPDGLPQVFLLGDNSQLYTASQALDGPWSRWQSLGGDWP
jgi:hypothetical protein